MYFSHVGACGLTSSYQIELGGRCHSSVLLRALVPQLEGPLPLLSASPPVIQDAAQTLYFQGAMRFPAVVAEILKSWCRVDTYLSDWQCPQMPQLAVRAHTCWVSALLFQCTFHRASQFRQCFKNDVRLCPLGFKVLRSGVLVFCLPFPTLCICLSLAPVLRAHRG